MSCQDNETAQVAAAVAGDREALARLLVAHSELLTRRLRARVQLNPVVDFSVEDVLQEVFLDVHRGIGTFRTDSGTAFAAWLQKVADNRLAAMLRHRNRVKRGGRRRRVPLFSPSLESSVNLLVQHLVVDDRGGGSKKVAREELIAAIRDGLSALPPDQRAAVEQRYLHERSLDSTAETMQITEGALRGLIRRAKRAMRDALGESARWFQK